MLIHEGIVSVGGLDLSSDVPHSGNKKNTSHKKIRERYILAKHGPKLHYYCEDIIIGIIIS